MGGFRPLPDKRRYALDKEASGANGTERKKKTRKTEQTNKQKTRTTSHQKF